MSRGSMEVPLVYKNKKKFIDEIIIHLILILEQVRN